MIISLDLYVLPYLKWVLPYISYFDNDEKKTFLMIKDDRVLIENNEIWDKIKKASNKIWQHACLW